MTKDQILAELQRVASLLRTQSVSQNDLLRHGKISVGRVCHAFGSWNQAVQEAGLTPNLYSRGTPTYADEDLLYEIVRLTKALEKELTEEDMDGYGIATSTPYKRRWGSFAKAREEAYSRFGIPLVLGINRQQTQEVQKTCSGLLDES